MKIEAESTNVLRVQWGTRAPGRSIAVFSPGDVREVGSGDLWSHGRCCIEPRVPCAVRDGAEMSVVRRGACSRAKRMLVMRSERWSKSQVLPY